MNKNTNEKIDLSLSNEEFYKRYGRRKIVSTFTLGCKVNQYETQAVTELFEREGYEVVSFEEKADVYVVNTCTVTNLSDRKSRQMIRKAKSNNGNAIIAVIGCYAQTAPSEVLDIPGVNLVIGTKDRSRIIEYINEIESNTHKVDKVNNIMQAKAFEELKIDSYKERTRAFLKIQEGCSQFCAYCIIPYARGPIRSRTPADVVNEVKKLADAGFKEVVLTGIHIASYGKDIGKTSLLEIIREVHQMEGIERIRLGSLEPTIITDSFINVAREMSKLCPHYHLSLQSGCDKTLKRMNRKYTIQEYKTVVESLRMSFDDVAITTDVMVGFPGETDEEFEETYSFLEQISLAQMHIFKYSPRRGTPAASFENQVTPEKKEERSNRLIDLSKQNSIKFNKRFLGRIMPVLLEQEVNGDNGVMEGLTSNYIKVVCKADQEEKGRIVDIKLEELCDDCIKGRLIYK